MPTFYEFFAGGGMARAGLGKEWKCLFANDIDAKKAASYCANWDASTLSVCDIATLKKDSIPGKADLAWASFPCQDLSLAGAGAGLKGDRSGTFWSFWRLMQDLIKENRAPKLIVLENVCGALTSHGGKDFSAIGEAFAQADYQFGAVIINAASFLPQSRPRLFLIAATTEIHIPKNLKTSAPSHPWHSSALIQAHSGLSQNAASKWVWWKLPTPPERIQNFVDIIESEPQGVRWHTQAETKRLLSLMSDVHLEKVKIAKNMKRLVVGAVYKRTRKEANGIKTQRAEVRFDNLAGCLRTPVGGSSRQSILVIEGQTEGQYVRSRLLSTREAARLMGLPDTYQLPTHYNEAYHLLGDGLAVPVVRFLACNLLESLLASIKTIIKNKAA